MCVSFSQRAAREAIALTWSLFTERRISTLATFRSVRPRDEAGAFKKNAEPRSVLTLRIPTRGRDVDGLSAARACP